MLRNFRTVFKSNKAPMGVIMMVVLLGMVAYLAPSRGGNLEAPDNVLARVYGRDIVRRDLDRAMSDMVRRLGKNANLEAMAPIIKTQAMSTLVRDRLMEELAERHGILVTDAEVKTALEAQLRQVGFIGEDNKLRPSSEINDMLRERGWSLKQLETTITTDLAKQKLFQQEAAQVPVDPAWVDLENRVRDEKISFEAVSQVPDAKVADPDPSKLEAFYQASGARFQSGPRRVIDYVALTQAALGITPADDAAVKAVYDSRKGEFTEMKASHILFKAETEAEVQEALKKAQDLRPKLLAGQDFAKTAEALSQDPTAKANKGDLGWFGTGAMQKPFEQAAMALKEGEISEPVRTSFGIHLIRLEGRRTKPFEQVKEQLRAQLTRERFATKAKDKLEQLRKRAGDRGDIKAAAKNLGLKVQTSAPFSEDTGAALDGLTGSQELTGEAFRLDVGQVSKVRQAQDAFVVFRVQDERPIGIPPFAEIKGQVTEAWKLEEARRVAMDKAKEALKSGDLKALGTPETKDGVTISSLGELGKHPAIRKALLDTPAGSLTPLLWTADGKLWVARIKARIPAGGLSFAARKTLIEQMQMDVAQKFLSAEIQAMERQGNQRPGFSSFYGRYNGIWRNREALGAGVDGLPDLGGLDD